MNIHHHMVAVLGRVVYLGKLRKATLELFDHDASLNRVRASVVAVAVADVIGVENSPSFRADLTQALKAAGWRSVNRDGVRYWKGVTAK